MANDTGRSGKRKSPGKKIHRQKSRSSREKREFIILPAIASNENFTTVKPSDLSARKNADTSSAKAKSKAIDKPGAPTNSQQSKAVLAVDVEEISAGDGAFLPEYRSQTNGLRELLSTIDASDDAYHGLGAPFEPQLYETNMHIPHSAPGLPGSPDLPIGPTRWGLYISSTLAGLGILFVSALAFSHVTSPTGIDWAKVQTKTVETYQWMVADRSTQTTSEKFAARSVQNDLSDLLDDIQDNNGTVVATASRISTTAASPKRGTIKTPSAAEIFISPEELENQIRALEGVTGKSAKTRTASIKSRRTSPRTTRRKYAEFEQLVVIPAANIDPDMENQIFRRARSYLKQRDISSARMILQYAATLGSGISAMALAETFDPNYVEKINLHGVSSSARDARKWYYMAVRLGIKEADARLTALK